MMIGAKAQRNGEGTEFDEVAGDGQDYHDCRQNGDAGQRLGARRTAIGDLLFFAIHINLPPAAAPLPADAAQFTATV